MIAVATLLDLADAFTFSFAQAAALLLLVIGAGMAIGGFVGRARWLVASRARWSPRSPWCSPCSHVDLDDGIGDRTVTIRSLDEPVERRLGGGDMTVDLIDLRPR